MGVESLMGTDPLGETFVSSPAGPKLGVSVENQMKQRPPAPPTPVRKSSVSAPVSTSIPPPEEMAMLVGIPPPPPSTPPPRRQKGAKGTPRSGGSRKQKDGSSPRTKPPASPTTNHSTVQSLVEEVLKQQQQRSIMSITTDLPVKSGGPEHDSKVFTVGEKIPHSTPVRSSHTGNKVHTLRDPPASENYESFGTGFGGVINNGSMHKEASPWNSGQENEFPSPAQRTVVTADTTSVNNEMRQQIHRQQISPFSMATEPTSNNAHATHPISSGNIPNESEGQTPYSFELTGDGVDSTQHKVDPQPHHGGFRPKNPDRLRSKTTPDRLRRPKTPERLRRMLLDDHSRHQQHQLHKQHQKHTNHRRHLKSEDLSSSNDLLKGPTANSQKKIPDTRHRRVRTLSDLRPEATRRRPKTPQAVGKSNSSATEDSVKSTKKQGFFRKLFGGKKSKSKDDRLLDGTGSEDHSQENDGMTFESDHGRTTVTVGHDEISRGWPATKLPMEREQTKISSQERADADVLFRRYSSGGPDRHASEERGSIFFAHDEVSTLTSPTMDMYPRAKDPTEANAQVVEPVGHYWNHLVARSAQDDDGFPRIDPFTEPFFHEPSGASPMPTKNGSVPSDNLRIYVPPSNDPMGESPLNSHKVPSAASTQNAVHDPSPQGFLIGPSVFGETPNQDPIGESPLHKHDRGPTALLDGTPYAPDPPLYLSDMDDDISSISGAEEKKEEEAVPSSLNSSQVAVPPSPKSPSSRIIRAHSGKRHLRASPRNRPPLSESPRSADGSVKLTIQSAARGSVYSTSPSSVSASGRSSKVGGSPSNKHDSPATPPSQNRDSLKKEDEQKEPLPASSETKVQNKLADACGKTEDEVNTPLSPKAGAKARIKAKHRKQAQIMKEKESPQKQVVSAPVETSNAPSDPKSEQGPTSESISQPQTRKSKILTMSSAARVNAKAVSYIRTLNGELSPRHDWHQPELSDDDFSPRISEIPSRQKASEGVLMSNDEDQPTSGVIDSDAVLEQEEKLFLAYSGRFKGRKPITGARSNTTELVKRNVLKKKTPPPEPRKKPKVVAWKQTNPLGRNVGISSGAVSLGFALLREKREDDISNGRSHRVVPVKKAVVPKVQSYFGPYDDQEPKDPIQRAGRRLLSRAAVPVQAVVRRHLAQREAVDRMWALLEIQSYVRRWRAEMAFVASVVSAIKIQKVFRGVLNRSSYSMKREAIIEIQRMIRGYICAVRVYEDVYRIILLQARARGNQVRRDVTMLKTNAISIQSVYRSSRARKMKDKKIQGVCKVQAQWRSYLIRTCYQFVVVDIIITQSIVRRWIACRRIKDLREKRKVAASIKIQRSWKAHLNRENKAAIKIQTIWRGFQSYTDYIFALVDVLIVQRTIRKWLAQQKALGLRKQKLALTIQTNWRRRKAQKQFLYDLVNVIIVQVSIIRSLLCSMFT